MTTAQVRVWEETVEIPTYRVGEPDKNPMFLEKRVYQGSSGKVYPYPVIDKISDEKKLHSYQLVCLENEYLHIEIMPELGGRVYRALDKTHGYDFVYYNHVIKPALVGLAGPWISGGIEFNWPQHHRPNTFGPVSYSLAHEADGGKTVWLSEIDRMYGTKMTAGLTLLPGKAYLAVHVHLYNRTAEPQTFLWWANPAVAANEHTQSVFPPDVHAVFDHGRRDVSAFPIATGTYYKVDYSAGVDISWYKNIPVPTSYMVYHSEYDFVGGYDHARQAGILHVANHHISPGKKQWTWGNGAFGKAWERNLTDEDGAYIELMTGVYTDNQPDFSWLQPYEEKSFTQYFMPYKDIGIVKNASIDAAIYLDVDTGKHTATIKVYATSVFADAVIELKGIQRTYVHETVMISPQHIFSTEVPVGVDEQAHNVVATVYDAYGQILVAYRPEQPGVTTLPEAARRLPVPEEMSSSEAFYLAGLHLEQYRHATFEPATYYLEGLKRFPHDIRLNIAYGKLLLRRGLLQTSESHFRTAITTLTQHNPNPYDGEAYYQLGVVLKLQGRSDDAFSAFYKAIWSAAWQDSSYFSLAQIACASQAYEEALELVERSLQRNSRNYKAYHLKAVLLRKVGNIEEALHICTETHQLDTADFGSYYEQYLLYQASGEEKLAEKSKSELTRLLRNDVHNFIVLANDYYHCGLYEESIAILQQIVEGTQNHIYPMLHYYLSYFHEKMGQTELAQTHRKAGSMADSAYCFPNSIDDLIVLEHAIIANPGDAKAHYYIGNLLYDKKRHADAIAHWELSREADNTFATVQRNLALAYYNTLGKSEQARISLEQAFACNPTDARVCYELDQLYKKLGYPPTQRIAFLDNCWELVMARDDLYLEYVTILNTEGQYERARMLLEQRLFHPWEGGEGKVTGQYVFALVGLGKQYLATNQDQEAVKSFEQAMVYPENLGEGKLAGAQENNIHYYLGHAYEKLGSTQKALEHFHIASRGLEKPENAVYYNDQPPDMIFYQGLAWLKLGNSDEAQRRFHALITYGEEHFSDTVTIDYFAVSLPDFLVFEEDLQRRNELHCRYMIGLGYLGLQEFAKANAQFLAITAIDPNHQGAIIHRVND